jgi:hypothetical protein
VNGISYLFSAATELFIRVPKIHQKTKPSFSEDMKLGLRFVWRNRGMRFLMLSAGVLNFLGFVAIVLLIPLFQRTDFLGPARYGVAMATFTAGMIVGMGLTASVKIPPEKRLLFFGIGNVGFTVPLAVFPLFGSFWPMLVSIAIAGFFNAIVNVLIQSVLQLTVPQQMRGKVFGLLETVTQGLTPIGMALGGVLGEFLPLRLVISGALAAIGVFIFPQLASRSIRAFFATDTEVEPQQPPDPEEDTE